MHSQRRGIVLLLGLIFFILMLGVILVASVGCPETIFDLVIENRTEQVLIITVNDYLVGEVNPGAQITRKEVDMEIGEYLIVARNSQGEIIFSREFAWDELQEIERGKVYKAVIPPLQNVSNSDNTTGK